MNGLRSQREKRVFQFAAGRCYVRVAAFILITVNGKHSRFPRQAFCTPNCFVVPRTPLEWSHKYDCCQWFVFPPSEPVDLLLSTFSYRRMHSHVFTVKEAASLLVICHSSPLYYKPPLLHTPNPPPPLPPSFPKSFLYVCGCPLSLWFWYFITAGGNWADLEAAELFYNADVWGCRRRQPVSERHVFICQRAGSSVRTHNKVHFSPTWAS